MQKIKYGGIQNTTFTPDKELNILIYRTPSYLILAIIYKLLQMMQFLSHPVVFSVYLLFTWSVYKSKCLKSKK